MSINKRILLQCIGIFVVFAIIITLILGRHTRNNGIQFVSHEAELNADIVNLSGEKALPDSTILVTIFDLDGNVIAGYDDVERSALSDRHELFLAKTKGKGFVIRDVNDVPYFFFVKRYDDRYVRVAKPVSLIAGIRANSYAPIVAIILIFMASFVCFYLVACRFGKTITALKNLIEKVDSGDRYNFPDGEFKEISEYIVNTYKNLDRTQKALNLEREKLQAHLRLSKRGLAIFTPQRKEILSNELFIQYINMVSDHPRRYSEEFFNMHEVDEIIDFLDDFQCRNLTQIETKAIQIHKNDTILVLHCIIFQDKSFEVTIEDITEKEEQAILKKQLTQNISHELKTPVASIQGYMETLIQNPDMEADKRNFFVERCYTQAVRLTNLLQDISTLNKIDEAQDMFAGEDVNIYTIVDNVRKDLALKLEEKGDTVEVDMEENLMIKGNVSLLYSIFRNLMDNALAYAGDGITIHISCYRSDSDFYYFSFYDNGPGVDDAHLNRLFERFYRVDKGRSRKMGGTGLGLAIVKNAVSFHHGRISAKNRQGGGLEFLFTLKKS